MSISLTEDIKTSDELRTDANAILDHVRRTGRPILVTVGGKPAVVLLEVAQFERLLSAFNLSRYLVEAEEDVRAGRTQVLDEVVEELERGNQIPSRSHGQRKK